MPGDFWQGTNLPRVAGFNRAVVWDAIRSHGEVSRVELAEKTGLTAQTMSNIVRGLIDDGLVAESGNARSTGGKPRVMLRVVTDAYSALGLHLTPERITGVLVDVTGRVQLRSQRAVPDGASPADVLDALARTSRQLVSRYLRDPSRILGVGLAVPGPLDGSHRRALSSPDFPNWSDVPLADLVEQRVGFPVVMDNDATAAAIGERWTRGADRVGSFVYAYLDSGVRIGVVLDDQVYRGMTSNAGGIGHLASGGGRSCACGKRGCLESYCSMGALVAEWRSAANGHFGRPTGLVAEYERMCRAVVDGDETAVRVLRGAARRLGRALAGVVSLLDVDRIVLGGPVLGRAGTRQRVAELVRSRVGEALDAHVWAREVRPVSVRLGLAGQEAGPVGAAALVLDHAYAPRLTALLGR
jgi:predicted NBD/HSP70 family sugar kinase